MRVLIALLFAFLMLSAVSSRRCVVRRFCKPKRVCRLVRTKRQITLRRRAFKTVRKFKYVSVLQLRKVCYNKRVKQRYTYIVYSKKAVNVRVQYLKKVAYKVWVPYKKRIRRTKVVRYKKYYFAKRRKSKIVTYRKRVYYYRLVTVPKRCPRPYWYYYWTYVTKPYTGRCRRRQRYLKIVRYRTTCAYRARVKYYTKEMIKVGNCYKRKIKYRWVTRYRKCIKTKKVVAWRWTWKRCTKHKKVRVRRRKRRLRWGFYCKKKVKRRFSKLVTYKKKVYYYVTVKLFRWKKRTIKYWVTVVRRRLVTRTRLVVRVKVVRRFVRVVKRVVRLRWTTVPAFRTIKYYVRVLKAYLVKLPYYRLIKKTIYGRKRVCVRLTACYRKRICH